MGFLLNTTMDEPFYLGGSTTSLTPYIAEAALGGHPYMIDWLAEIPLVHRPVPVQRQQADQSDAPGEQTINPEAFWRRSGESWHLGAGQATFDRRNDPFTNPFRFFESQGVDVWTKWEFSLLKDTIQAQAEGDGEERLAVAGTRVYYLHGTGAATTLEYTPDLTTFTAVTGDPNVTGLSIVSDGFNVWTAHGTSGIYKTNNTIGTMASNITGTVALLGYVRQRILAASGPAVYDVTALAYAAGPAALPAALFTHANADFDWTCFAEGSGFIYMGGYSGDKSLIYRTAVKQDGTALDAPIVAAHLPHGEQITAMEGYLGKFVAIGTNKGWRLAVVQDNGDLLLGRLVRTTSPVLCFEGQEEFIWYGLSNLTSTHTGLGRLSTSSFSDLDALQPAYATDLMAVDQGAVNSVVTFLDRRVFSVEDQGVYAEHATRLVPEGYIDSGEITYGMTEPKIGLYIDHHFAGTGGCAAFYLNSEHDSPGIFNFVGEHCGDMVGPHPVFPLGQIESKHFSLRIVLTRDALLDSNGLTFRAWTMRIQPRPEAVNMIFATVLFAPELASLTDTPLDMLPYVEQDYLEELHRNQTVTTWQQGERSYTVILEEFEVVYKDLLQEVEGYQDHNSSVFLKMKRV